MASCSGNKQALIIIFPSYQLDYYLYVLVLLILGHPVITVAVVTTNDEYLGTGLH